jgi:hypothetical protein
MTDQLAWLPTRCTHVHAHAEQVMPPRVRHASLTRDRLAQHQPATRSALVAQLLACGLTLTQADALAERQHAALAQEV